MNIPYPSNYLEPLELDIPTFRVEFSNGFDIDIQASNEEEAREEAMYKFRNDPQVYKYISINDSIVEVTNLTESENYGT